MSHSGSRTLTIGQDDGLSLRIWDGETDQTVLLIHGLADCSWAWAPMVDHWPGARPTFIAVDLPGHGESAPVPRGQMKSDLLAERLHNALKASDVLSGSPLWVVAHSAGAKVAIALLKLGVDMAQGLTLLDTADQHTPEVHERLIAHVAAMRQGASDVTGLVALITAVDPFANRALIDGYFRAATRHDGTVWRLPLARGIEAILEADIDILGDLGQLDLPVQIIRGTGSSICTEAMAQKFLDACRQPLPLVAIRWAGHGVTMAQPVALAEAIAAALPAAADSLRH